MKNHNVIVFVDTTNISETTIENDSWLGWPGRTGMNEDYTTEVKAGDTITWLGLSTTSPNDLVNITKIRYEGGNNLLGRSKLNGNGESPEKVIGSVIDFKDVPNQMPESYTISFTVSNGNNGGERHGKFHIDPKLGTNN